MADKYVSWDGKGLTKESRYGALIPGGLKLKTYCLLQALNDPYEIQRALENNHRKQSCLRLGHEIGKPEPLGTCTMMASGRYSHRLLVHC